MIYTIKAIPTKYAGVTFRSRLEARWAAFFDLVGWQWDYEPFDLEGWAPDFKLDSPQGAVLVEVKPIDFADDVETAKDQARESAPKAFDYALHISSRLEIDERPPMEILVIGNGPFASGYDWGLGVFALEEWNGSCSGIEIAVLWLGNGKRRLDFSAWGGGASYRYRMEGIHEGDHHLKPIRSDEPQTYWREAGNRTQWSP